MASLNLDLIIALQCHIYYTADKLVLHVTSTFVPSKTLIFQDSYVHTVLHLPH